MMPVIASSVGAVTHRALVLSPPPVKQGSPRLHTDLHLYAREGENVIIYCGICGERASGSFCGYCGSRITEMPEVPPLIATSDEKVRDQEISDAYQHEACREPDRSIDSRAVDMPLSGQRRNARGVAIILGSVLLVGTGYFLATGTDLLRSKAAVTTLRPSLIQSDSSGTSQPSPTASLGALPPTGQPSQPPLSGPTAVTSPVSPPCTDVPVTAYSTWSAESSADSEGNITTFDAGNLIDGEASTAWRTWGDGRGATVLIRYRDASGDSTVIRAACL